jgi:hypothetical protein
MMVPVYVRRYAIQYYSTPCTAVEQSQLSHTLQTAINQLPEILQHSYLEKQEGELDYPQSRLQSMHIRYKFVQRP